MSGEQLAGFRFRGVTPSPDAFHRFLWEQVVAQFIVESMDGTAIGLVTSYGADYRNQYAYVAAVSVPAQKGSGAVLAALAELISYLFKQFPFRKLYAESLERNFVEFASGASRYFDVEGRLVDHEYVGGKFEDFVILAVHREKWEAAGVRRGLAVIR